MGGGRFLFRLVFGYRFGELIGAGSAVAASDASQKVLDVVDIFALDESGDSLQVSAAATDKAHIVQLVVRVDVEENLS